MSNVRKQLTQKPKSIFLIDSLGAFVTAFFLFAILRTFEEYFGMPPNVVTYLSLLAMLLCLFSMSCFFGVKQNWRLFLTIIGIANFLYCFITIGFVVNFYDKLTILGVTYFSIETILVCMLVYVELRISFLGTRVKFLL